MALPLTPVNTDTLIGLWPARLQDLVDELGFDTNGDHLRGIWDIVGTDGVFIVSDSNGNWVGESGATARSSLGLVIGTNVQAFHAHLATLSGLSSVANLSTIANLASVANLSTLAGLSSVANLSTLANLASVANLSTIAGLASIANLSAIAGLTSAADKIGYFTGAGSAAVADFSAFARTLIDDADAAAARTTLGFLESIIIACSDEVTPITSGANKVKFRIPYAFTLTDVRASLSTAQSSGSIFTVDIHESGTTILSTKLTFDNTEKTTTTGTPPVISDTSLADDAEITVDVDQIGNGTACGLKVYMIGRRT